MTATHIEWQYDPVTGNIIDVYMFKSDIYEIPSDPQEVFDQAYYDALAALEADQERES